MTWNTEMQESTNVNDINSVFQSAFLQKNRFTLAQFVQIVETVPIAVSITDAKGNIVYINPSFETTTGYSSEELLGKKHSIVSYQTTPQSVYQELWKTIQAGNIWTGHLVNRRKNAEKYVAEVKISGLMTSDHNNTYYVGIQRDISQRHKREIELDNKLELLSALVNTIPNAVALLDEHFSIVLDNLAYKTLTQDFQQEPASLVIEKISEQYEVTQDSPLSTLSFEQAKNITVEFTPNGPSRWFSCRLMKLELSNSDAETFFSPTKTSQWVLTMTETTREHRHAQQQRLAELQILTAESELMHAMQETMHAVFHQLQQPVNVIESAIGMVRQRHADCTAQKPLQIAHEAGQKALIQLQEALPERPHEAIQSVNLNQLVHELSAMMSPRFITRSIDLQLQLKGTLPSFNAQPIRLRVALKQILDNAIEAIDVAKKAERIIRLTTQQEDDAFILTIEDSGNGIEREQALKIFQPFYSTKSNLKEGTRGIGLTIVQQVIAEHCGTVQVETSDLGGAAIKIVLQRI